MVAGVEANLGKLVHVVAFEGQPKIVLLDAYVDGRQCRIHNKRNHRIWKCVALGTPFVFNTSDLEYYIPPLMVVGWPEGWLMRLDDDLLLSETTEKETEFPCQ